MQTLRQIPISKPDITAAEKTAVLDVLDSGLLAQGARTAEFERRFARMCGVEHAIAVSSGTSALHIALLANGVGPGDEVITSAFTFIATANAILFAGAKPVFADIDRETFNLDPTLLEAAITPRTKAIVPVHLYGQVCDMDAIQAIADAHNLAIVEDACQAVMATYKGRRAGSFGTGTFSFYATKNMMTGEGGMITTDDDDIADRCRLFRNHGMRVRYHHDTIGHNFRMTDMQAALGLVQLERLPTFTERRQANAAYLNHHIESVETPRCRPENEHVWHQYTVRIDHGRDRNAAAHTLQAAGIGTGIYYPIPVHQQASMQPFIDPVTLPVTEVLARSVLSLPVHPQLDLHDLARIVEEVNQL